VWTPRKLFGNAKDFYETSAALRSTFDADWSLALQSHGLSLAILRRDVSGGAALDGDGNGTHDVIDEVSEVLAGSARLIFGVFDYYAALVEETRDSSGELNVFKMTFNAYMDWARRCRLVTPHCNASLLQFVWVQVNAIDAATAKANEFNHLKMMVRYEFIEAIVRIAMLSYNDSGLEMTVAAAVGRVLTLVATHAAPEAKHDANLFRRKYCYAQLTDAELKRRKPSLLALFEVYANVNRSHTHDQLQSASMMSVGEWLDFLEHTGLLEMGQLSLFGAKMIFLWSRIRCIKDHQAASERRLRNLFFEDFLEALVRVAHSIALPTDEEIAEAKVDDAAHFLMALSSSPHALAEFINAHKTGWATEPRQRINRCVGHLCTVLVSTVEKGLNFHTIGVRVDRKLTLNEVSAFETMRRKGRCLAQIQSDAALLDGVQAATFIVRERLLKAVHKVALFEDLDERMMGTLIDAMVDAKFEEGEFVFEQGDEGDAFYVITEGEACIVREEPGESPTILAQVGEGAYFGERSLLKDQVRYASVQTTSPTMHCMCVHREGLEKSLGYRFEDLVPDCYKLDRRELLARLHGVELFHRLSMAQLETIAEEMDGEEFPRGGWVFHEGEVAHHFYILTEGTAEVLKRGQAAPRDAGVHTPVNDDDDHDGAHAEDGAHADHEEGEAAGRSSTYTVLKRLKQWDFFGERSLLTNETRFAGVRATSASLQVLCISRKAFEAAMGPLKRLVTAINYN